MTYNHLHAHSLQDRRDFLALLPARVTRALRSPRFRVCSPKIRKKSRLICRLDTFSLTKLYIQNFIVKNWTGELETDINLFFTINDTGYSECDEPISARLQRYPLFQYILIDISKSSAPTIAFLAF